MKLLSDKDNIDNPTSEEMMSILSRLGTEPDGFVILLKDQESEMLQAIYSHKRLTFRYQNDKKRIMETTETMPSLNQIIEPMKKFLSGDQQWRCNLEFKKEYFPGIRGVLEKIYDRYTKNS